jgi:hypothetical protein
MPLERDTEREWVRQWRDAAVSLAEQRQKALRQLTDQQALAASEALLSLVTTVTLSPSRRTSSGLVQQQALFHRRTPK